MGSLRDFFRKVKESVTKPIEVVSSPYLWYVKINLHTRRAEETFKCELREPNGGPAVASVYNTLRCEYDDPVYDIRKLPNQKTEYPQLVWQQCSRVDRLTKQQTPGRAGIIVETNGSMDTAVVYAEQFFNHIWP